MIKDLFVLLFDRFEDVESLSELDEEVALPKKARIIAANVIGIKYCLFQCLILSRDKFSKKLVKLNSYK